MINVSTIHLTSNSFKGEIAFKINDILYEVAFKDPELKKGEFVAACSPIYSNDIFELKTPFRED